MTKPKIFITQPIQESALQRLRKAMDIEVHPDSSGTISKKDLIKGVSRNDYLFCRLGDIVDAEVIAANPNLKLIATMASSPGAIDVKEANRRKIPITGRKMPVTGIPADAIFEETADLTWALLLAVARRIVEGDKLARAGIFPGCQSMYLMGSLVYGETLGIIGMGKVGEAVARRARGFSMKILYYSRKQYQEIESRLGVITYVSLEELLKESDFVSLHPKYTPETHHMIGDREFSLMKPTSFLINTSRGPVVDQESLIRALRSKMIAGAALDVFEGEPYPHLPKELINLKNVVLTPHIGSGVAEKRELMANVVVDRILAFIEGKTPPVIFNPEIYGEKK